MCGRTVVCIELGKMALSTKYIIRFYCLFFVLSFASCRCHTFPFHFNSFADGNLLLCVCVCVMVVSSKTLLHHYGGESSCLLSQYLSKHRELCFANCTSLGCVPILRTLLSILLPPARRKPIGREKICFPQLFVDVAARLPFRSADLCQRAEEIPYVGSKSGCVFLCQQSRRCCLVLLLRGKDCSAALASEKCVAKRRRLFF